jgi:diguanylate cyclase (GGDEF)-like protein
MEAHGPHFAPITVEQAAAERETRRDEAARSRDLMAAARDLAADTRDEEGERIDAALSADDACGLPARRLRLAGATARRHARADRIHAAKDRLLAAEDRISADAYRGQVGIALERAHSDGLTGAQMRDLGRDTLEHEIERSRRSGEPFVLAFVDVDGLKQLNDRDGHAAGDALLKGVVAALSAGRRSYDAIVRIGGDEFLCGFTNTDLTASRRRIEEIRDSLERTHAQGSISAGLAILGDGDTLEKLIARADADMYSGKQLRAAQHGRD